MTRFLKYLIALVAVSVVVGTATLKPSYNPTVPGALNPSVTQATIKSTICVTGWTATIRPPASYTTALKAKQLPKGADLTQYEEDHAISLELGGNPIDPNNLWPQPYPQAHWKDRTENYLKAQVCSGAMTLAAAQKAVLNWYPVYTSLSHTLGAAVEASDSDDY